jgi:hypothetical protein
MARTPKAQVPGEYIPASAPPSAFEVEVADAFIESWRGEENPVAFWERLRRTNPLEYIKQFPVMNAIKVRERTSNQPTSSIRVLSAVPRTALDGPPRDE